MEHHSNIVPWQLLCAERGAELVVLRIAAQGDALEAIDGLLDARTRIVAVGHASNALGAIHDVRAITAAAHEVGAVVVVDGAQAVPHLPVDVQSLGCDFYALSGHKMYGPTGIGALYGRHELLETMPPWQGGGDMIRSVRFTGTEYAEPPYRFEAGTPDIAGAIGLGAAIDWLAGVGLDAIAAHEAALLAYATTRLRAEPDVRVLGHTPPKVPLVSFLLGDIHPHDVGTLLDLGGVAVRAGHHCAEPLMERLELPGTVRASFACYNRLDEIDRLVAGLARARETFA
jgi:cysteine desulfurase / selenocysteine lyase